VIKLDPFFVIIDFVSPHSERERELHRKTATVLAIEYIEKTPMALVVVHDTKRIRSIDAEFLVFVPSKGETNEASTDESTE